MSLIKFGICQISLNLTDYPYKIVNLEEHNEKILKCIEFMIHHGVDYLIFPEYTFNNLLLDNYNKLSKKICIIGGSHLNAENFNETVLGLNGEIIAYNKIQLSPYENPQIGKGTDNPTFFKSKEQNLISVLTCMDYFAKGHDISQQQIDNNYIDVIFSPALNNNQKIFYEEAQSIHNHRSNLYSIICNASSLILDGKMQSENTNYGGSCIFGSHDNLRVNEIQKGGFRNEKYSNMIIQLPFNKEIACTISLEVPYNLARRSTLEYRANPQEYKIINIDEILAFK